MKKLLIALVLGLLLVAALATVASADNGPHGGFTATTDACANCHRAHSAQTGDNALLIVPGGSEALCLSCHDGSGAGTDVVDGIYVGSTEGDTVNNSLLAGGFDFAKMATTWSGAVTANPAFNAVSKPTTSHHKTETVETIWGSGANNTANGAMTLECISCHDPHGNAGWTNAAGVTATTNACNQALSATQPCSVRVPTYRLLRWQPTGSNGFTAPTGVINWSGGVFPTGNAAAAANQQLTGWTVPDNYTTNGTEWYTIGATSAFAVGDYAAGSVNNVYNAAGHSNIAAGVNVAFFCAQCHDRYFNNSRMRNNTDVSLYCGAPVAGAFSNGVALPFNAPVAGQHPIDPVRCEPVVSSTTGLITGWGDNAGSGDTTYMFRHASGDIRISMDGTSAAGAGTSISRSCVACHVAHGSTATMTTLADNATLVTPSVAGNNSILLRLDNRSMCLRCHTPNFTVAP